MLLPTAARRCARQVESNAKGSTGPRVPRHAPRRATRRAWEPTLVHKPSRRLESTTVNRV